MNVDWLISGAAGGAIAACATAAYVRRLRHQLQREQCAREVAEEEFAKQERRYRDVVETAPDIIYQLSVDGTIVSLNPAFERITGWPPDEIIGRPFIDLLHPNDTSAAIEKFWDVVGRKHTPAPLELRMRTKTGAFVTGEFSAAPLIEHGKIVGELGVARDITERKRAEARLIRASYYDSLTGVPNMELFRDRLHQAVLHAKRHKKMLAVLFLNLDRFKGINTSLGHSSGDLLLKAVAERLTACIRECDTIGRHGGDEFVMLFPDISRDKDAVVVSGKVNDALANGFSMAGQDVFVTASIGISVYPSDGGDADTLIRNADAAMSLAKEQGGCAYRFYTPEMNAAALHKFRLEGSLRKALDRGEFLLHYQPQVELATGRVSGAEALVRWRHPSLGVLAPMEFIPMAEETGLIVPLGAWIMRNACRQGTTWQEEGYLPVRMAMNLSMRQFRHNDIAKTIGEALEASRFDPARLDLELTESILMQNADQTIATLRNLKSLGVRVTIDDFGTGYSSLSYLKDLPIDALKLDISFVSGIAKNRSDEAISRAVISLAHNLNLKVIAEGVETADQLEFLRGLGCDEVQGFLFSRPLPPADAALFMDGNLSRAA